MIARAHGIALAAFLGAASVAGAYATITTAHLGDSETKPEVVASTAIARRGARLDAWEASLRKALASRPPALPTVPRYARASLVSAPSYGALPALAPAARTAQPAIPPAGAKVTAPRARSPRTVPVAARQVPVTRSRIAPTVPRDEMEVPEPVTKAPAETAPAPPSLPTPVPASAPAATPLTQPAPTKLSKSEAERQCEALKRAAEQQGEAAKKEAERQCEALKKAAEGNG